MKERTKFLLLVISVLAMGILAKYLMTQSGSSATCVGLVVSGISFAIGLGLASGDILAIDLLIAVVGIPCLAIFAFISCVASDEFSLGIVAAIRDFSFGGGFLLSCSVLVAMWASWQRKKYRPDFSGARLLFFGIVLVAIFVV